MMKKTFFFLTLWLFWGNLAAQNSDSFQADSIRYFFRMAKIKQSADLRPAAIEDLRKALSFCKPVYGVRTDTLRADIYNTLADLWGDACEYDSCAYYQDICMALYKKIYGPKSKYVANALNNSAGLYAVRWDIAKAIQMRSEALQILVEIDSTNKNIPIVCNNLAAVYMVNQDLERSRFFYEQTIHYMQRIPISEGLRAAFWDNYSYCLARNKLFRESAWAFAKSDSIVKTQKMGQVYLLNHLQNRGDLFVLQEQAPNHTDSAIVWYKKYLRELLKEPDPNKSLLTSAYGVIAEQYVATNQWDSCVLYTQLALEVAKGPFKGKGSNFVQGYRRLGIYMKSQGNYPDAIRYLNQSLEANNYHNTVNDFLLPPEGIGTLYELAQTYNLMGDAQNCLHYFSLMDSLLMLEYFRMRAPGSKNMLADDANRVYAGVIETMAKWADQEPTLQKSLFHFSEQAKSKLLYESFRESRALRISNIPDSLLQQEEKIKMELSLLEGKKNEGAVSGSLSKETADFIHARMAQLTLQYEALLHRLETDYPDYYRAKYDLRTETVESIQRGVLKPGQTMLEYFIGNSNLFIFVVQAQRFEVVRVPLDFPLEDWVKAMRSGITDWYLKQDPFLKYSASLERYAEAARQLYQKLIAPVAGYLPAGGQVIIIPDGLLTYVPFEALLKEKPEDIRETGAYKYWVLDQDICYCYSATLLREMCARVHKTQPKFPFLGMAPTYAGDTTSIKSSLRDLVSVRMGHNPLDYNDVEVDSIQSMIGGQIFTGADATKKCFMDTAAFFRVVHTSVHSEANDHSGDQSYLAFYEDTKGSIESEWLFVQEVYSLHLNADLVTLSACQTGLGELHRGEGIIGLARAFTYAGAKSIVNSLWNTEDMRTMMLMVDFYRHLKNGDRKDVGLSAAKRAFIFSGDKHAHPFFWAGFIGIGDMSAIRF